LDDDSLESGLIAYYELLSSKLDDLCVSPFAQFTANPLPGEADQSC
jgi:hypothetical protein